MKKTLLLLCIIFLSFSLFSETRGLKKKIKALDEYAEVGKQYLVLIAVNKYEEWTPLKNPVKDAKRIKEILTERYYIDEVIELFDEDAKKGNIYKMFRELQSKVKVEDSVLIYYAGHGYLDEEVTGNGYWIPVEGGLDEFEQSNWIPNSNIRGMIDKLKSKHVLLISDSCFSGDLLAANRGKGPDINQEYYANAYKKRARQILTSGASEEVPDSSSFAKQLSLFLEENNRPYIDPLLIFSEIRLGVRDTTPMFGSLANTNHQDGASFLLFLKDDPGHEKAVVDRKENTAVEDIPTDGGSLKDVYRDLLAKINPKSAEISTLTRDYENLEDYIEKITDEGWDDLLIYSRDIEKNLTVSLNASINDVYGQSMEILAESRFDDAAGELNMVYDFIESRNLNYDTGKIKAGLDKIESNKSEFESLRLDEISTLMKETDDDSVNIDNQYEKLDKIESVVAMTKSSYDTLDNRLNEAKKYLGLYTNIQEILNEQKDSTKKKKVGVGLGTTFLCLGVASGALIGAFYGVHSIYYDKYLNAYDSFNLNPTDSLKNSVMREAEFANGFFYASIAMIPTASLSILISIISFAVAPYPARFERRIDKIRDQIDNFQVSIRPDEQIELAYSIRW